jgi:hypothetical protein
VPVSVPALPRYLAYENYDTRIADSIALQIVTLPIDTVKVRMQLLTKGATTPSMFSVMRNIVAEEGITALYKGFWPAIHRQLVFASLRVGLYGQASSTVLSPFY